MPRSARRRRPFSRTRATKSGSSPERSSTNPSRTIRSRSAGVICSSSSAVQIPSFGTITTVQLGCDGEVQEGLEVRTSSAHLHSGRNRVVTSTSRAATSRCRIGLRWERGAGACWVCWVCCFRPNRFSACGALLLRTATATVSRGSSRRCGVSSPPLAVSRSGLVLGGPTRLSRCPGSDPGGVGQARQGQDRGVARDLGALRGSNVVPLGPPKVSGSNHDRTEGTVARFFRTGVECWSDTFSGGVLLRPECLQPAEGLPSRPGRLVRPPSEPPNRSSAHPHRSQARCAPTSHGHAECVGHGAPARTASSRNSDGCRSRRSQRASVVGERRRSRRSLVRK